MGTQLFRQERGDLSSDKEALYLLGGAALILIGAGIILSNSAVRKYMGELNIGGLAKDLVPDIDRYLKLRSM